MREPLSHGNAGGNGSIGGWAGSSTGPIAEAGPSLAGKMAAESGDMVGPHARIAHGANAPGNGLTSKPSNKLGSEPILHDSGEGLHGGMETPGARQYHRSGSNSRTKKQGVEISGDNVWQAFLSTRPSLSRDDRARYDSAYRKFRGGSRPADFNPISSVDDGTLRTALK